MLEPLNVVGQPQNSSVMCVSGDQSNVTISQDFPSMRSKLGYWCNQLI